MLFTATRMAAGMIQADMTETFSGAGALPARLPGTVAGGLVANSEYWAILLLIMSTGLIDCIWCLRAGVSFTGWARPGFTVTGCGLIWLVYSRIRPRPRLAEFAAYGALWIAFTALGCILTYLAATASRPLLDNVFTGFDSGVGFDWVAWTTYLQSRPPLQIPLILAYNSMFPQVLGSLILFSLAGVTARNQEFLLNAMVALFITALIFAIWPSLGPCVWFEHKGAISDDIYADVLRLRSGEASTFDLGRLQGLIFFPSYHTVLALLLIYAHRGLRWTFPPVLAVNIMMLLSVPSEGGHYFVDMVGGAGVTIAAIALVRKKWKSNSRVTAAT
jgi:PAP2 superfamily protein